MTLRDCQGDVSADSAVFLFPAFEGTWQWNLPQKRAGQRRPALEQHVGAVSQRLDHLMRIAGADHHRARIVIESPCLGGYFALAHDDAERDLLHDPAIRALLAPDASREGKIALLDAIRDHQDRRWAEVVLTLMESDDEVVLEGDAT